MPEPGVVRAGPAKFTIGRDKDCDVPIADDSVSRVHAQLTMLDSGKLLLEDRASSNGTSIMQAGTPKRIEQSYVSPEDQVQFGSVVLSVSDIIDAIRAKAAKAGVVKTPAALGGKLIRCECGAVKPAGGRCRECGILSTCARSRNASDSGPCPIAA